MREIEAPDGTILEFPDNMSDVEIQSVMKKNYPYEPVDFKATTAIKNIPSSTLQLGKDLWTAVTNPIDTLGSIRNLAQGIVEKAIPNTINGIDFGETENEKMVNAVGNHLVDRYGSLDAIKTTLMNDPAGLLLDASAILTGGGSLAVKAPGVVGKVASGIQAVGQAVDPLNLAASTVKYAGGKVLPKDLPANMLEEVMKFSTTLDERFGAGTTESMVATMLRENVPVTKAGNARLNTKISGLVGKVDKIIRDASRSGKKISQNLLMTELQGLRRQSNNVGNPYRASDLKQIDDLIKETQRHFDDFGGNKGLLTLENVQSLKRKWYEKIDFQKQNPNKPESLSQITEEGTAALGRGAKKRLEEAAPDVSGANLALGELLDLKNLGLGRATSRISHQDAIGMSPLIKSQIGSNLAGDIGTMTGLVGSLAMKPRGKAALAQELYNTQKRGLGEFFNNKWTGSSEIPVISGLVGDIPLGAIGIGSSAVPTLLRQGTSYGGDYLDDKDRYRASNRRIQ